MAFPVLPTRVNCPQCHHPFNVDLHTIIDVGQQPELKEALLRGEINVAHCPECGAGGMLSSPILYHDPGHELLISFVPAELGMTNEESERYIGSLVKAVMDSLPPEQRKAYFFQPKTALTMDGLFDMILEADGVSPEALAAQRNRMRLLNQLVPLMDDDKAFAEVVDQHRAELDYEFLLVISSLIDASAAEGNTETVATLETLRDKILTLVEIAGPRQAPPNATAEELIELLLAGSKENNWRSYIALNRARLDYAFFQVLTGQIEAAQAAEDSQRAQELTELRDKILQELDVQESMLRSVEDQAVLRIMDLLDAPDLAAALREQRRNLDEVMLSTVARLRAEAVRSKRDERAAQLQAILDGALELLEADLPPAARLINQLMRASYPDGTNQLLEEHRAGLTDELVAMVDQYIDNLERVNRAEQAAHLKQVRDQITAKRLILR